MEIVYHLGAHYTDEDRLSKALLKSRAAFADEGIVIPWPRHYRYIFRDLLVRLDGEPASEEVQNLILDAVMQQDAPRRVVFSHDQFLGLPSHALGEGMIYPAAAARAVALRNIFPDNPVSFCIALRNPATFLPMLFQASGETDASAFLAGTDPLALRWSDTLARIRAAVPRSPITVWCNEDTPVLWPTLLRQVAGSRPDAPLTGADDFLATVFTPEGLSRMNAYLAEHPPASEARRRYVVDAFLRKFGRPEQIEVEIDMPDWTQTLVDALTAAYDEDIGRISQMEGVTLIA